MDRRTFLATGFARVALGSGAIAQLEQHLNAAPATTNDRAVSTVPFDHRNPTRP
jgi:hypothetical protein